MHLPARQVAGGVQWISRLTLKRQRLACFSVGAVPIAATRLKGITPFTETDLEKGQRFRCVMPAEHIQSRRVSRFGRGLRNEFNG